MSDSEVRATVDLSLVVNIFREGRLIHPTLRDLSSLTAEVVTRGWSVEVILVLDSTDAKTHTYLDEFAGGLFGDLPVFQLAVQHRDLGLSRNSGVAFARGRHIAFSDADNLYSHNWLVDALERLIEGGRREILHPEIILNFEAKNVIWRIMSSDDSNFDPQGMVEHNYWDAMCMAPREAFEQFPYVASLAGPGFGPEDWQWNCETLDNGWMHNPVPRTVMFYRVKFSGSLALHHESSWALLAPTTLLSPRSLLRTARRARPSRSAPVEGLGMESLDVSTTKLRFDPLRRGALRAARGVARALARGLRSAARLHPRVDGFQRDVRPIVADLLAPPRRNAILRRPDETGEGDFPDWLIEAWRAAHHTEPALFPEAARMSAMIRWIPAPGDYTAVYWQVVDSFRFDDAVADYVFLVPWMATGGASSVIENYLRAVREETPDARILVLSTLNGFSSIRSGSPLTRFARVPAEFYRLPALQQAHLLATVLVQVAPRVIHLVNSPAGFDAYERYAKLLASQSKLFLSVFTLDETPEGQRNHFVLTAIRTYFDDLDGVFVDNAALKDTLVETYALPPAKFFVHYQPPPPPAIESAARRTARRAGLAGGAPRLRVLWAGRLDRQKRPDILAAISEAARARGLPIDFTAAGAGVLEPGGDAIRQLGQAGVAYVGEYKGTIGSIRGSFDVLLLTSQWEGLPLTLLDAALHGLTIVAGPVGGVPDFVIDGETGYLPSRYDDVDGYLQVLERLAGDHSDLIATRTRAMELVNSRHSWDEFVARLWASAGYFR